MSRYLCNFFKKYVVYFKCYTDIKRVAQKCVSPAKSDLRIFFVLRIFIWNKLNKKMGIKEHKLWFGILRTKRDIAQSTSYDNRNLSSLHFVSSSLRQS